MQNLEAFHLREISINKIPSPVIRVVKILRQRGHNAYIVGGALRDLLLGIDAVDWDVATSAHFSETTKIFSGYRHFILKDQILTLLQEGSRIEITSFRGPDRHDLIQDLARRDFTINAIAYEILEQTLIDPFQGQKDLSNKIIRAVGNPQDRFKEDPLRMLRGIRLACELSSPGVKGFYKIAPDTLRAIDQLKGLIGQVAPERIREELMRILLSWKPSYGFGLMRKTGLLAILFPELMEGYRKRQNRFHRYTIFRHVMETVDNIRAEPLLRLAALLHDVGKPRCRKKEKGQWRFIGHERLGAQMARSIMDGFRFSKTLTDKVVTLVGHHEILYRPDWSDAAVRRLIRKVGPELIGHLVELRRADLKAHGDVGGKITEPIDELARRIDCVLRSDELVLGPSQLAIDGTVVMEALGIPPSPLVGKILKKLVEMVTDNPALNNRGDLLNLLKGMKARGEETDFLDQ